MMGHCFAHVNQWFVYNQKQQNWDGDLTWGPLLNLRGESVIRKLVSVCRGRQKDFFLDSAIIHVQNKFSIIPLIQAIKNAKLSLHGFWRCPEDGLIKTIQTMPHKLYVNFKSASILLRIRLDPNHQTRISLNPHQRAANFKLTYKL